MDETITITLTKTDQTHYVRYSKYRGITEPVWLTEGGERIVFRRLCAGRIKSTGKQCENGVLEGQPVCSFHITSHQKYLQEKLENE